jgi:hypothetical protein
MSKFGPLHTVVSALLIVSVSLTASAQQVSGLSKQAAEVKRVADSLSPGSKIRVIPVDSPERSGTFVSSGPESFTFHDVEARADVTLKYSDVRKIKQEYNSSTGKHNKRKGGIIAAVLVFGLLGGLIIAAANSKD